MEFIFSPSFSHPVVKETLPRQLISRRATETTSENLGTRPPNRRTGAFLGGILGALGLASTNVSYRRASASQKPKRTVVITGANSGIGLATAKELAVRGWQIIPACRSKAKTLETKETLLDEVPESSVLCLDNNCDLSDLKSVGGFGRSLRSSGQTVDALILNAGIDGAPLSQTTQGHELHFGVNHLGHFCLWLSIQDLLQKGSRVVSVTSSAALDAELDLEDVSWKRREYGRHVAYATSKACNVLFVDELARNGKVNVNAIDPGPTASLIVRYAMPERAEQRRDMSPQALARQARMLGLKTPEQASAGLVWLTDSDEASTVNGEWLSGPATPFPSLDLKWRTPANAKALWKLSEDLVAPYIL